MNKQRIKFVQSFLSADYIKQSLSQYKTQNYNDIFNFMISKIYVGKTEGNNYSEKKHKAIINKA